jgi:zinc protease
VKRIASGILRIASLALAGQAAAQGLDRTKRPVADAPAPFGFPKMETRRLSNGLLVVVIENHSLPLVAVRAVVPADSLDDPIGKEGLFALISGMLSEGTTTRTGDEIANAIAALGNAVSPSRFTTIPDNLAPSLELMADMLMHPTFPDSALTRLKTSLAAAKLRDLQTPATIPNRVFLSHLYGPSHQIARAVSATQASIASITRADVQRYYQAYYRPVRTTLVIVGDVRSADAFALASKHFGSWRSPGEVPSLAIPTHAVSPTTIYLIDRPGAQQSYVFVGGLGPARSSNDFAALEAMAPILGSSVSSRLLDNLRERHGFVYAGTPFAVVWRRDPFPSLLGGSAAVASAKIDSALMAWLGELRGMAQRPPTPDEMRLARGWLVDALPAQIETDDLIANRVMSMLQTGAPLDFYNSYGRRIEAVTSAEVSAAAAKYIDSSHLVIVVAGDRKVVEPVLRAANIAPIVVVDDAGKS